MAVRFIRNVLAGALIASVPLSTATAAVRPNAAVPMASSTAVVAQDDDGVFGDAGLLALLGIAAIALVALIVAFSEDDRDPADLSPG